ncbi:hypothetical protein D3C81_2322660 [compost metagenome]
MLACQMVAVNGKLQLGVFRVGDDASRIDIQWIEGMKLGFAYRSLGQNANAAPPGELYLDDIACH